MSAKETNLPLQPPRAAWLQQLDRIEHKLDVLIKALADEDEQPTETLDGAPNPPARNPQQSLD